MGWTVDVHNLPGNTAKKVATVPTVDWSFQDRLNEFGYGELVVAATNPRLAEILDPENDVGSLIWAKRDGQATDLAWFARTWDEEITDEIGRVVRITGPGIAAALDQSIVEPFNPPDALDHVYGGHNVLRNPGFEDVGETPETWEIWNDATGGTFTLTVDGQTTAAIAYNASPSTVEFDLEALSTVTEAYVSGAGTEADPWVVEFADPFNPTTVTGNGAGLTGGTEGLVLTKEQEGVWTFLPWTKSQRIDTGTPFVFGRHASDSPKIVTTPVDTGTYALQFNGLEAAFTGVQQIVRVTPGQTYQASLMVNPSSGSDIWRLVIRDRSEQLIATSAPFSGASFTASTWSTLSISDVTIPDGVDQVIFRFAYVGTGNPLPVTIDNAELLEGKAAAPAGEIMNDLLVLAQAKSSLTWLSWTFTDTLDSAGNAWADTLSMVIHHGKSLAHVLRDLARRGVEWRVFWTGSAWELGLYNPYNYGTYAGGVGTDRTGGNSPALHIGKGVERGPVKLNEPAANVIFAEGAGGLWTSVQDAASIAVWGRREAYIRDLSIDDSATLTLLANTQLSRRGLVVADKLKLNAQAPRPYDVFGLGDTLQVGLPPRSGRTPRRVVGITTSGQFGELYEVDLDSEVFGRNSSIAEGVRRLLVRFNELDFSQPLGDIVPLTGAGGVPTVYVAASDSSTKSQDLADYICDGTDDHVQINAALDVCNTLGHGRVMLSEGTFVLGSGATITVHDDCALVGLKFGTVVDLTGTGATLEYGNNSVVEDIRFDEEIGG